MRIYRCAVHKAPFPVGQAEPLRGSMVGAKFGTCHGPRAAGMIPGCPDLYFCEVFGVNLCSFFSSFSCSCRFKGKQTILSPRIPPSFSLQAFSGIWKQESFEEEGEGGEKEWGRTSD